MPARKKKQKIIGIDLGGTKLLAGIFNKNLKLQGTHKLKVRLDEGEKFFLKSLDEAFSILFKENGSSLKDLAAVGIGCPGIIDRNGRVSLSPNIPFLKNYPLKKNLEKRFGVPVAVGNDVNVGLLGEHKFGAAKGYEHVVGIFLGTGIGGALILNGEVYEGAAGAAGEIGHMLMDPLGEMCGCGSRGCLETMIGRIAIASEAAVLSAKQKAPHLFLHAGSDLSKIKSGALARAVQEGDKAIETLIRHKARTLGIACVNVVHLLNPELIVLGGGVMEALGEMILPEVEKFLDRHAIPAMREHVKVTSAKLKDNAIVYGAAKMAFDLLQ